MVVGMTQVKLYCGPNCSGRSGLIDRQVVEAWGQALLIVPSRGHALRRQEHLLLKHALAGAVGRPIQTFADFAVSLLEAEGRQVRRLDDFARRMLLEQCLEQLRNEGRLGPLQNTEQSPGVAAHLMRVITQLKQAAIEPPVFRARTESEDAPFDRVVADLYEAYQERLIGSGRHDVPGLFWEANLCCEGTPPRVLSSIGLVCFDGFDDFTPSEFRLLESLGRHAERMLIGMNCDLSPDRQDLYLLPREAVERLSRVFETQPIVVEAEEPGTWSRFSARHLFWRDRPPAPPASLLRNITIVPCADPLHEAETLGRAVKRLIVEHNAAPEKIAVVFRTAEAPAQLMRLVFAEFGIPFRMRGGLALSQSLWAQWVTGFFKATQQWSRQSVLDMLTRPVLTGAGTSPDTFPLLARAARIVGGRAEWRKALENLLSQLKEPKGRDILSLLKRLPDAVRHTQALLKSLSQLESWAERWPSKASQREFAVTLDALVSEWAKECGDCIPAQENHAALRALRTLLGGMADADVSGQVLASAVFIERLNAGMRQTTVPARDSGYGVHLGDAASIRQMEFEHVFFGGLIEGEVPVPPSGNALYPESEIERLRRSGIALEDAREHSARERLLFHHVIDAALGTLTLTWTLQKNDGRPAMPSALLTELRGLFPADCGMEQNPPESSGFLPQAHEIASTRDLRNALFFAGVSERQQFAAYDWETMELERWSDRACGPFDGVLSSPELIGQIAEKFDAAHEFSVNQLEMYLNCPFRFFAERLLHLDSESLPEAEFDNRVRGTILHAALTDFHGRHCGRAFAGLSLDKVREDMHECVQNAFSKHAWRSSTVSGGVIAAEQAHMLHMLNRYLEIEAALEDAEDWRPFLFEVPFGHPRGDEEEDAKKMHPALKLNTAEGVVCIGGRIDRIDENGEKTRIVDYKTSTAPSVAAIKSGRRLQLSVYAWALRQDVDPSRECAEAVYLRPGKKERREALFGSKPEEFQQREQSTRAAIEGVVRGIRTGQFFPNHSAENCGYCAFQHACRRNIERLKRKLPKQEEGASSSLDPE